MALVKNSYFLLLLLLIGVGCKTIDLREQTIQLPNHNWSSKDSTDYQFTIDDSTAYYKISFVIRHHNAYQYKNIWVQLTTMAPGEKPTKQSFNLNLADDLKGWLGSGMDDIFDQRIPFTPTPVKLHKGLYHFNLQHTMRQDPLQNLLSVGIRVEKVKP